MACELLAKGVGEAFEACFARVVGCFALGSTGFRRCQATITVAGTQGERKVVSDKSTPEIGESFSISDSPSVSACEQIHVQISDISMRQPVFHHHAPSPRAITTPENHPRNAPEEHPVQ